MKTQPFFRSGEARGITALPTLRKVKCSRDFQVSQSARCNRHAYAGMPVQRWRAAPQGRELETARREALTGREESA
eukprot:365121-Chlamydomonas_euryale.AAC.5